MRSGGVLGVLAVIVVTSIVFACGDDDSSTNNATSSSSSSSSSSGAIDGGVDGEVPPLPAVDWIVEYSNETPGKPISKRLLGQYELSGSLLAYDKVAGLPAAMKAVGMSDWRVGLGRWEVSTQLLPTLTDGTDCVASLAVFPDYLHAPATATDLTIATARDWFVDDGQPVTLAATADDARYSLSYVRSVLDVADAFGAKPLLNIDHMPRAFATNKTFTRVKTAGDPSPCTFTWTNGVSNCAPDSAYLSTNPGPPIFATAVANLVKHIVEGGGNTPDKPRDVTDFELWNEPDLGYAWDPLFDDTKHTKYFQAMLESLVLLDAYRTQSKKPLRFGLGSYAVADYAVAALQGLDTGTVQVPVDFFSFHSYSNDPLVIADDIQKMISARASSTHFKQSELYLTEWGVNLGTPPDAASMDGPLLVATVLAIAAPLGLDRAYHSLFYDFLPGLPFGLVDHDAKPKPLYRAFELLVKILGGGGEAYPLNPSGQGGRFDGLYENGQGVGLAVSDGTTIRLLLINRNNAPRTMQILASNDAQRAQFALRPKTATTFDDPAQPTHPLPIADPGVITLPPRSITLFEL